MDHKNLKLTDYLWHTKREEVLNKKADLMGLEHVDTNMPGDRIENCIGTDIALFDLLFLQLLNIMHPFGSLQLIFIRELDL